MVFLFLFHVVFLQSKRTFKQSNDVLQNSHHSTKFRKLLNKTVDHESVIHHSARNFALISISN